MATVFDNLSLSLFTTLCPPPKFQEKAKVSLLNDTPLNWFSFLLLVATIDSVHFYYPQDAGNSLVQFEGNQVFVVVVIVAVV